MTTTSKKKVKKPTTTKTSVYTWQIYSTYGYVRAKNMTDAICKAIRGYYGSKSRETLVRFDMLVKKGKHNVY